MAAGTLEALIARAVDFYGPGVTDKSAAGLLVFTNLKKGKTAQWMVNADVPRSYTYVPDAAKALYRLAVTREAFGQVWHLPSVQPPLTGRAFIRLAATHMQASDKVFVLPGWLLKIVGWFHPFIHEMTEMNYQDAGPFVFDSTKFERTFGIKATPYEEAIRTTARWFLTQS